MTEHPTDHPDFRVTAYPSGVVDIAVCWDRMSVTDVIDGLRQIIEGLEKVPPGTTAAGIVPL